MIKFAIAERKAKVARRKQVAAERRARIFMLNARPMMTESNANTSTEELEDLPDINDIEFTDQIFDDLLRNRTISPYGRTYSEETYEFAKLVHQSGNSVYEIIRKTLPLPSAQSLYSKFNKLTEKSRKDLLDMKNLPDIIRAWKISCGIKSNDYISMGLSVDAICFKPDVYIQSDNSVYGTSSPFNLSSQEVDILSQNTDYFAEFVSQHWDEVLTAAFVYQLQPLSGNFSNFIAFIQPASNGKAGSTQVETLNAIREICSKNKVTIKVFSFDGDNGYMAFHNEYFDGYCRRFEKSLHIIDASPKHKLRIISDPLHILKRVRYRLVQNGDLIIPGFSEDCGMINIDEIKRQLNLPMVVFSNDSYTKMHDSLPGILFSITSLIKLLESQNMAAVTYFLPWVLITTALQNESIDANAVHDLFEIAFFYLYFYCDAFVSNEESIKKTMSEKKAIDKYMVMYPLQLVVETMNSLHSIIMLMETEDILEIDRATTRPLEHTFGISRMKTKYAQKYKHILNSLSSNYFKIISLNLTRLNGRIKKCGRTVSFDTNQYEQTFSCDNRKIAFSLTKLWGNPSCDNVDAPIVIEQFLYELTHSPGIADKDSQCIKLSLSNLLLGTQNNSSIRDHLFSKSTIGKMIKIDGSVIEATLKDTFGEKPTLPQLISLAEKLSLNITRSMKRSRAETIREFIRQWPRIHPLIDQISISIS